MENIIEEQYKQKNPYRDNRLRHIRIVNQWNEHLQSLIDKGIETGKLTPLQYLYSMREINISYLKQAKSIILNVENKLEKNNLTSYQSAVILIKEIASLFFKPKKIITAPYKQMVTDITKTIEVLDKPEIWDFEEKKQSIQGVISIILSIVPMGI